MTATYYNQGGGSACRTDSYPGTGARVSQVIGAPGGACSQVASAIYSGGSLPVTAVINQVLPGTPKSTSYEAITAPSIVVVAALWRNQPGTWISGLVVQNVTNQTAQITITYYDSSGNPYGSPVPQTLPPQAIYVGGSGGAPEGSLVVTADRLIAAVINLSLSITGDGGMSYAGINR